jgi:ankyrin repeat protein
LDPVGTIKYLVSAGAPVDVEDIVGLTALHIATFGHAVKLDIARLLLQSGANVNHQDRYGSVAILSPMQTNSIPAVELLLEFGADLHIAEADNVSPQSLCMRCGPQVTAVFEKWKRKRAGEEAPREEKKCGACGSRGSGEKKLLQCARCHTIFYCSKQCQSTFLVVCSLVFLD